MSGTSIGRRVSYDGALCTVRCEVDHVPGTKGEWLGVEWDDPSRGKHDGSIHGRRYFKCRSIQPKTASFVRPARKSDPERTLLQAIRDKYAASDSQTQLRETVIISGKVAEEVGFDKIIKEQATLTNIKIAILESMVITGIASRDASLETIRQAQEELTLTCSNITDLDLSYNPIEHWSDIEDICAALPKLRTLKLNSVRLQDLNSATQDSTRTCFRNVRELHLNKCLLSPSEVLTILQAPDGPRFPALQSLWLSQNELSEFGVVTGQEAVTFTSVATLVFEDNFFTSIDPIISIISIFPHINHLSFQSNKIELFGPTLSTSLQQFPELTSLNLSQNNIKSSQFLDLLSQIVPNLSALRVSKNPVYDNNEFSISSSRPEDSSYYLTLARFPNLRTLNHTDITIRDREEGEIYYLSVVEKEIRRTLSKLSNRSTQVARVTAPKFTKQYQWYEALCQKHDRDNLISQFMLMITSSVTAESVTPAQIAPQKSLSSGTVASRLVTATFHIGGSTSPLTPPVTTQSPLSFTRPIPNTIPTSSLYSLVSRELHLPSLSFKLVYESEELDPVRDDLTTRSQIYADPARGARRWDDWGDWDADALVEEMLHRQSSTNDNDDQKQDVGPVDAAAAAAASGIKHATEQEKWTADGVLIKGGRKWRKREVEMLFGMRPWGDWLENGVKECRIRVEPLAVNGKRRKEV